MEKVNFKRVEAGTLRKFYTILFFVFFTNLIAQTGYVPYDHPIHVFLERAGALGIISDYDPFELPKTRSEIASHLVTINHNRQRLNPVDIKILEDFLAEFNYDINFADGEFQNFLPKFQFSEIFSQKEKFIYSIVDSNKHSLFINFEANNSNFFRNDFYNSKYSNTSIFQYGGSVRGALWNKVGFYIKATNGTFLGNRELASMQNNLRYNFKFNEYQDGKPLGGDYFDETEGYLMLDLENAKIKIGRDRMSIGYGNVKYLLSDQSPPMDYISLNLNYSIFSFSYFHGKLFGSETIKIDSSVGTLRNITDKYLAYHRLGFNFSKHFKLGIGEAVVYSRRNIDFSYLNPFNFYKSVEHLNQDRDNAMLFFDFKNNSIEGVNFYATLLIDDLDFGKIGTDWYGNQTLVNIGIYSTLLYDLIPLDIRIQYLKVDPYVYTHRIFDNNYSNYGFPLTDDFQPNSDLIDVSINYYPHHRISIKPGFRFQRHGANELNSDGTVKTNYGGDFLVGYRGGDPTSVSFLDGVKEYTRMFSLHLVYEPVNNYFLWLNAMYKNSDKQNLKEEYFETSFGFKVRL